MDDTKEQLEAKKAALDAEIPGFAAQLQTDEFHAKSTYDKDLLRLQHHLMASLSSVYADRIARFTA
jgi:hypothetical protein